MEDDLGFVVNPVVAQYYEADVNKEHVIRGNSAVMKCLIPSFVADFVEVVSWHTDDNDSYYPAQEMGLFWLTIQKITPLQSLQKIHPSSIFLRLFGFCCCVHLCLVHTGFWVFKASTSTTSNFMSKSLE